MWVYQRVPNFQAPFLRVSEGLWHRHCQIWHLRGQYQTAEGLRADGTMRFVLICSWLFFFFSIIPFLNTSSSRIKWVDSWLWDIHEHVWYLMVFSSKSKLGKEFRVQKQLQTYVINGSCGLGSCHTQQNLPLVVEIKNEPPVNQPRYENFRKLHRSQVIKVMKKDHLSKTKTMDFHRPFGIFPEVDPVSDHPWPPLA